ncbi:MAG: exodeoxyribonuclease VII large subunit [Anaerococcus sp.]|nr:exodeoxyribonuclease VII large subunit [Anaerococcus sp.]
MRKPLSVKQFNEYFKSNIKHDPIFQNIYISGQLANIRINNSHLYFSLKEDKDLIDCVVYYYEDKGINIDFLDGKQVLLKGNLLYNNYSSRLLIAGKEIKDMGLSKAYDEFLQMKEKFRKLGYFSKENKKDIVKLPKKLGLITSKDGAALVDFLSVINQKPSDIHIYFYPVKVQGEKSSGQVVRAIEYLDGLDLDLIVITRGGGSNEDLSSFNQEDLIKAVFLAKTPIISAIGHKIDQTLLDLVSDLSLQTPTEAGSFIIKDYLDLEKRARDCLDRMGGLIKTRLEDLTLKSFYLGKSLGNLSPSTKLDLSLRDLANLMDKIELRVSKSLDVSNNRAKMFGVRLKNEKDLIDLRKKTIGIRKLDGSKVFSSFSIKTGDELEIDFSDGRVRVRVIDE